MNSKCSVCRCDKDQIPIAWIEQEKTDLIKGNRKFDPNWTEDEKMSLNDDWNWRVEEFTKEEGSYVDLRLNDEGYTGY